MRKHFFTVILLMSAVVSSYAQFQLSNNGFEEWEDVSYSNKTGNEPIGWSSFLDGTGSMKSLAAANQLEKSTDVRPGTTGKYSAKLFSRKVIFSIVAQGNLTNGCVNMGSISATDASGNYNYINHGRQDQSMRFAGRPDAVKIWTKFNGTKTGNVEVSLITDGYYQSPRSDKNPATATLVAHAKNSEIESNDTWTEYVIPFDYPESVASDVRPEFVLVNISTCAEPGGGSGTDYLIADDIEMVYNSELSAAKYAGRSLTVTDGVATVDAIYDAELLELESNGRGASVAKTYDIKTGIVKVVVTGDNIAEDASNKHEYTIKFNIDHGTLGIDSVNASEEDGKIYDVSGRQVTKTVNGLYIKNGKAFIAK